MTLVAQIERMREKERKRILERINVRVLEENKMSEEMCAELRIRYYDRDKKKKLGFVDLNSLTSTMYRLLTSSRISLEQRSQEILMFTYCGLAMTLGLLKFFDEFKDDIKNKRMKALVEREIREAVWELEDALDSQISRQFGSQSETDESIQLVGDERRPLLFSLNLQGIVPDVDNFVEKMIKMEKLFNPWISPEEEEEEREEGEEEEEYDSDNSGLSDKPSVRVTRSSFMSWVATKAASVFLGVVEDYVKELEKMFPEEEEDDDYAVLFTKALEKLTFEEGGLEIDYEEDVDENDFLFHERVCRRKPSNRFGKIRDELIIWWINKAASIFVQEEEEYTQRLVNPLPQVYDVDLVSSTTESSLNMVGLTDLFHEIRDDLLRDFDQGIKIGIIVGMAGIGKTALAMKILQDSLIRSTFEHCIFVKLGQEYEWEEIVQAILAQMPNFDKRLEEGDQNLDLNLNELKYKKYLIVFDDVWNRNALETKLNTIFAGNKFGRWVLVTTRISKVATKLKSEVYQVPFLNKEESWDLLRTKVFAQEGCPPELEKAGMKIAENCEGLPLLILTVADPLSKAKKTREVWTKIAADKTNSIFVDAYEKISGVVYPSYNYLPQRLKACFLYLAAFPQNDEVRVSKLINRWSADGFLGTSYKSLERFVNNFLQEIVADNVCLGTQWSSIPGRLKVCSLHSVFWYLCKREARKEKFLLVLNSYADAMADDIGCYRRLCIYKNAIFSIKDARESIASMPVVRSLLCTGMYHQYQVPINFGLSLLKVFDALTIRFYEFPLDILKLIQLRYLALTCNGNLPPSISNLWGLESLILHQHMSIRCSVSESYLPVEIWELQELEYLQIMGRNLPDPPPGAVLTKLTMLLDVGAHTFNERVLGSIPDLKKLRVQIELMPGSGGPNNLWDDKSHLRAPRSLQIVVVNPELMAFETVAPAPFHSFSKVLKLTLSAFGYPWKDLNKIAALPYLKQLKLKCYAFRGEKWQVEEWEFPRLRYLSIEDTDLVQWIGYFPALQFLTIKNCYTLQEIPQMSSLEEIRLVDCNHSAVTRAEQMAASECRVYVDSSWLNNRKLSS